MSKALSGHATSSLKADKGARSCRDNEGTECEREIQRHTLSHIRLI
jgi:hypothetical protein